MSNPIQHIAIFRLSAMGDVAMTVPVIRAFASQNPKVKITMISRPFFKPFFNEIPNLNFFEIDLINRHKGFFGLIRLFLDLKRLNIDAIVDLHNVLRSKIIRTLFVLWGKKTASTDKGRKEKNALTRSENKIFKPLKTMFERHVETFKKLDFSIDLTVLNFPKKGDLSEAILNISGKKNHTKWIGIAPFAQHESKVYPQELMQKVIDELALNENTILFLFGGGDQEIQILNSFASNKMNVFVIAGKLFLKEELKLISNLDVMLSMDSGNAHMAAMLGIDVITLWGATHPYAGFSPFNQPIENCITSDREKFPFLPTSVYGNKKVAGYEEAMKTITVDSIVKRINKLVK